MQLKKAPGPGSLYGSLQYCTAARAHASYAHSAVHRDGPFSLCWVRVASLQQPKSGPTAGGKVQQLIPAAFAVARAALNSRFLICCQRMGTSNCHCDCAADLIAYTIRHGLPDPRHDPEYPRDHNRMFQYYSDPEPLLPNGRADDPECDLGDWALRKFCRDGW